MAAMTAADTAATAAETAATAAEEAAVKVAELVGADSGQATDADAAAVGGPFGCGRGSGGLRCCGCCR